MTRRRYELTDWEWSIIEPLLPDRPRGVPRVDERRVLNGILWHKAGVRDRLLAAVPAAFEGEIVMIDSTCVRVYQCGATGKNGDPMIVAWDVPEAASRARSTPSLMLTVVPSRSD